jgi:acyl-CoA dehydrogenase
MLNDYRSPWMDAELDLFRDNVRRFIAEELTAHDAKWRGQKHVDRSVWLKAGELGILLPDIPEEYGGAGAGFAWDAVVFEEMGYAGEAAFGKAVHNIAAHYLLAYGSEPQKRRWLPSMVRGEAIGAIAMTEPNAGSDLQAMRTVARREGDHIVVNGSKTFITNGYNADLVVLAVKTDPRQGAKGISLLAFDTRNTPGFRVGRNLEKIGMQGSDTCELFFDDCRVSADCLLGAEGRGFAQLMDQLPYERLIVGLSGLAAAERMYQLARDYVNERQAFGAPLASLQHVRFELAEIKTKVAVGRVFVDFLIQRMIEGKLDTVAASMGKYWLTDLQCETADRCLQLFGGYGYMMEYPIGRMYIDSRVQRIYAGTNEIMKELISRSL